MRLVWSRDAVTAWVAAIGPRYGVDARDVAIALVAVVLVVVVLARQVGGFRERALTSRMMEDLQRFALHQESIRRDLAVYAADAATIEARGFQPSAGVTIEVREATSSGWSAFAAHTDTPVRCFVFVGRAAPAGVARAPGRVACA